MDLPSETLDSSSCPPSSSLPQASERTCNPIVAFISGPVESDSEYFQSHYAARITTAIQAGHHFVLGASKGVDTFALEYLVAYPRAVSVGVVEETLNDRGVPRFLERVTVHLTQGEGRNQKVRQSPLMRALERGGGTVVVFVPPPDSPEDDGSNNRKDPNLHWTQRDEAMTRASHYDILRYRTDEECRALYGAKYRKRVSGTEKNELRRKSGMGLKY